MTSGDGAYHTKKRPKINRRGDVKPFAHSAAQFGAQMG
jgi:hypothetical protein